MKITIVQGAFLPVPPLLGGAVEKVWQALAKEFAARGHQVLHISRRFRDLPHREEVNGVAQLRVRGHDAPLALWRLKLLDLAYSLRVARVLPQADILVTNTFWLPIVARRASFGHPYIHVARYPRGQLRLYPRNATFQTVSSPIREAIRHELRHRSHPRIVVLPYPLTGSPAGLAREAEKKVILYAGRIHPEKGLELLVRAFRLLAASPAARDWELRLVGPWEAAQGGGGTTFREHLLNLGQGLRVEIPGPEFNHQALLATYGRAAVFAYPSLAEEGETFGLGVLEAMSAGAPPVVSNLACFQDFIQPGVNGLVFDHRKPKPEQILADALTVAISDPALRARLGNSALETASAYALPRITDRYLADFRAALTEKSATKAQAGAALSS